MDLHTHFRRGAKILALGHYGSIHREYGLNQYDWEMLTQEKPWTAEEARKARALVAEIIEICMTIAGMPPTPLPAQYAAAVISVVIAPANRMVAAIKAPDTFDAVKAAGVNQTSEIVPCEREQMIALVMAYSGGLGGEPMPRLDPIIEEVASKEALN